MIKPELLCPAGSWESMIAAVQNGADAVYLGGKAFSARAGASNFDDEQMRQAVDYCHLRGVRVYVTINTLIKQREMHNTLEFACFLYEIGVDALIIQDLGLARALAILMPDMPLHASTQMTVCDIQGVRALENMGFERIVLARELSANQIDKIKNETHAQLEVFVHGALCYCYSGQCLFSSILGGRSGNRGRCAQPCRLPYELIDSSNSVIKQGHLLSPKDLCLIEELPALSKIGVHSLKIEGRLKRAEYVAVVTQMYRKYIDNQTPVRREDINTLMNAFNRSGFTKAYFSGQIGESMMSYKTPTNTAGEQFPACVTETFHPNANFRKIDISASCRIVENKPISMQIIDSNGNAVLCEGAMPQTADDRPIERQRVIEQLSKFGATQFKLFNLELELSANVQIQISELNALRRNAAEALSNLRIQQKKRNPLKNDMLILQKPTKRAVSDIKFSVEVSSLEQAKIAIKYNPVRIYASSEVIEQLTGVGDVQIINKMTSVGDNYHHYENNRLANAKIDSILVDSYGLLTVCQNDKKVYGDYRLNLFNALAIEQCSSSGAQCVTLSPELNLKDILEIGMLTSCELEVIGYGHLPLMLIKNCVLKSCTGKCVKGQRAFWLRDRKNEKLPIMCDPISCTNTLLNAKPIYMADKLDEIAHAGVDIIRLVFTVESTDECEAVLDTYFNKKTKSTLFDSPNAFTRGHFYRGVE